MPTDPTVASWRARAACPPSRPRRARSAGTGALALALLAASCSGPEPIAQSDQAPLKAPESTTTVAPTTTLAVPVAPTWPLTGQAREAGAGAFPAVVVKVDNSPQARPHVGLDQADLVYELQVESITRFMELFHSQAPGKVGPVRSARSSDIDVLAGLNRPLMVWSGGNPGVTASVDDAARRSLLVDAGAGSPVQSLYYRDNGRGRQMPNNLFTGIPEIREAATPADAGPPPAVFAHRVAGDPQSASAVPAAGYRVEFSMGLVIDYVWDAERNGWDRFQVDQLHNRANSAFVDDGGAQASPENVVILFLEYSPDPIDGRSPKAHSVGGGRGVVLSGGQAVDVEWARPTPESPWILTETASKAAVKLAPGQTFAALVPEGQGSAAPLDAGEAADLLGLRR